MRTLRMILPICLLMALQSNAQIPPPSADSSNGSNLVFNKVEIDASYPGGDAAWTKYLQKNLKPDVPRDNGAPLGIYTVVVKFVVSKDGNITDLTAETNWGYGTEQEVMRIIRSSGKWNPAWQHGHFVNAYRRQPVSFVVDDGIIDIHPAAGGNYLYVGVDNLLSVEVKKVKNKDLNLTISQGSIAATEDGQFIARVTKPGRAIITVYSVKKDKELGQVSFEVKGKK